MKEIDLHKFQTRTDLAIEALETAAESHLNTERFTHDDIEVSKVIVFPENEKEIGRKAGLYITIETNAMKFQDHDLIKRTEEVLAKYLQDTLSSINIKKGDSCLVIGLGNRQVTPDALGPNVIDNLLVTKHIYTLQPNSIEKGFREVSAIAPGVMGQTGIETFQIVESVIKETKPNFVIVVDALASRAIERVNRTIQITDTGISPGSGVGNKRKEISKENLGIPVIAIGVPTVVDAVSIATDTINTVMKFLKNEIQDPMSPLEMNKKIMGNFGVLDEQDKRQLLYEALTPDGLNLMVTPKEIDDTLIHLTDIISTAIDKCLHDKIQ